MDESGIVKDGVFCAANARNKQKAAPAPVTTTGKKSELVLKPIPEGARTYTVLKGDTLASIAAKFYKNKGSWQKIRDANFEDAKGTPPIHGGQVLRIP